MKLDRVVIGMDFSAPAVAAARWVATRFAPGAELVLVHAIDIPEPPRFLRGRFPPTDVLVETAREGADKRMREVSASLPVRLIWPEVRVGHAAHRIAAVAREYSADLIVIGRHGERPGVWNRLGSTAERVLNDSTIPVLLASGLRDAAPKRILVPIDDAPVTPWVLQWARELAGRFDAEATALHVVSSAIFSSVIAMAAIGSGGTEAEPRRMRDELRREAAQWIARLTTAGVRRERVEGDVVFGDPGHEIVSAAKRLQADLIIMGAHDAGVVSRMILGSTVNEVLHGAPCPTLVVRRSEDELAA